MTQAFFSTTCPSCGAPVEAHSATAVMLVCGYCRSTLVRSGNGVDATGRNSALLEDFSPLQIGTTGQWNGQMFTLRGRLQVQYDGGLWNEWYAVFHDGSEGWLSESGDRYVFTRPVETLVDLPHFGEIIAGLSSISLNNHRFFAADVREIVLTNAAAEGELPFRLPEKQAHSRVSDWRSENLFLTVDYGNSDAAAPECFLGTGVRLADLQLEYCRPDEAIIQVAGRLKGEIAAENCPNCGSGLTWPNGLAEHLICPSCCSEIAIDSGKLQLIRANAMRAAQAGNAESAGKRRATLALGMVGKIDGAEYRVIGLIDQQEYPDLPVSYRDSDISGGKWLPEAEYWLEYLLYHPQKGFLWLVETAAGKWYRSETLDIWPRLNSNIEPIGKPLYRYAGRVNYAAGAFYWRVNADDITLYRDYRVSDSILSAAVTRSEMAWTRQKPLKIAEVYQWFKLSVPPSNSMAKNWWGHDEDDPDSGYRNRHRIGLTMAYLVVNFPLTAANWGDSELLIFVHVLVLMLIWAKPKNEED